MDITPLLKPGAQVVQGYGPGLIRVAGVAYTAPVFILPERTVLWPVEGGASFAVEDFELVIEAADEIDVLLVGTGKALRPLSAFVKGHLKTYGIVAEVMDTGAACRTWNVLMAEGRRVAATVVPV